MARLPTVLARSAGSPVGVPNVQVTNGAIAGGLANAAEGVARLDAKIQEANERDGRIWATRRNAELRANLLKAGTEKELSGEPLDGFGNWYETAATEAYDTALNDAPNNFARMYLEDAKVGAVASFGETGLRKEADYRVTRSISELDQTLESLKSLAFLDPGNAEKYAAEWMNARDGVPLPYDKAAALVGAEREIFGSAIGAMVESDPYGARGKVDGWVKNGYLSAEQGLTFQNRAEAGIKSREAEARARAAEGRAAAAEAAGEYLAGIDDDLAYVAAGNVPTPDMIAKYDPAVIASLPIKGADKLAKKTADAFARGEGIRDLLNAGTPAERARVIEGWREKAADPENFQFNQDTLRILESGAVELNDKLVKDPGGIAEMSDRVQTAILSGDGVKIVSASYAEQERQGIPPMQRKPFSNAYAVQVAEQISSLPPDQQAAALQDLQKTYKSYWPDVLRQIGDKLPGGLAIAATMPAGRGATRVAATAGLTADELTAGLEKSAVKEMDDAIESSERMSQLAAMLRSQQGGQKTLAQYQEAAKRSAFQIMRETSVDAETAYEQAITEITGDMVFREVNASVVALPADQNPDMIETGMASVLSGLDVSTLDLPGSVTNMAESDARAALASSIRREAEWVADGSGRGLVLRVMGEPVTRDGEPLFYTWEELKGAAPVRGVYSLPSIEDAAAAVPR